MHCMHCKSREIPPLQEVELSQTPAYTYITLLYTGTPCLATTVGAGSLVLK